MWMVASSVRVRLAPLAELIGHLARAISLCRGSQGISRGPQPSLPQQEQGAPRDTYVVISRRRPPKNTFNRFSVFESTVRIWTQFVSGTRFLSAPASTRIHSSDRISRLPFNTADCPN